MANNKQCEDCIHKVVCAYKEHYEDAVALYKEAEKESEKYPWFKWSINCIQFYSQKVINGSVRKAEKGGEE